MPHRQCIVTGCREWAVDGTSRCPRHPYRSGWKRRPSSTPSSAYRGAWPKLRAAKLNANPRCQVCGRPATQVDHIIPLSAGGTHDAANLQSICRPCHLTKSSAEGGRANARKYGHDR